MGFSMGRSMSKNPANCKAGNNMLPVCGNKRWMSASNCGIYVGTD